MFKHAFAAFVALLNLSNAVWAQTGAAQPEAQAQTASPDQTQLAARTCPLPAIANTAPLEQVAGSSLMTVPMAINGDKKNFLLDIGMKNLPEVSPELRAELSLPQAFQVAQDLPAAPGGFNGFDRGLTNVIVRDARDMRADAPQEDLVSAGSVDIGRATGHRRIFNVGENWQFEKKPYVGSLSGNFFQQYDVELDFGGRQITWLTPTACTDPHQVVFWAHTDVAVIPVTLAKDGRFQMQATVKGHAIDVELDTSSEHSIMRRGVAENDVGLKAEAPDMIPDGDRKDGEHMQIYLHTFPQLIFAGGSIVALNVPVRIQDYSLRPALARNASEHIRGALGAQERIPDLVMGMDLLKFLHLYIVPGQGRIYVTAAHEELSPGN